MNRFPFVANEYFNCEVNAFMDKFFDEPVVEDEFETPPKAAKAEDVQFLLLIK